MKKVILFVCALFVFGACVEENEAMSINQSYAAAEGDTEVETPLYWYLRCNTTSWNLDADSLLTDTDDPNVKSMIIEVTIPWMVTTGESCSVVRTEQEGQWFPGLTFFNSDTRPVIVPGGGTLQVSFGQFGVKYPALGTYEFLLNTEDLTFTITAVDDGGPTCSDGELNGDETDVDCGGPDCDGCADGKVCLANTDCLSNHCGDGICFTPVSTCDAESAVELAPSGQPLTVPSDGCVKVETGYPSWWGTSRTMNLINSDGSGYPIPFAWENACADGAGTGTFEQTWQQKFIGPTSAECATVINLQGNGSTTITFRWYGL